jgi:predicted TPR repeat methyltransferase
MDASPEDLDTLIRYADSLREHGKFEQAVAAYRQALEFGASRDRIEFALASMGFAQVPASAPLGYIRHHFDGFADDFDDYLKQLGYNVPELLIRPLSAWMRGRPLNVLDLGCGTGLCATLLRPMASRLVGVDISERMLERARATQLYDELHCTEITQALDSYEAVFDLIVAADTLIYTGDLTGVARAALKALRPAGVFAFSVEAGEGDPFSLHAGLRFSHSRPYLERLGVECGFTIRRIDRQTIRREHRANVDGYLVEMQAVTAAARQPQRRS